MYPTDRFDEEVAAYASRLAGQAPVSLARIRRAIYAAQDATFGEALKAEAALQREIFSSEDGFEGFRAFLEKRKPVWKGK